MIEFKTYRRSNRSKKILQEIITSGKTKKRKTNIIFKHTKLAAKVIMNCATAVLIDLRQT